jgi:hypothetical protein
MEAAYSKNIELVYIHHAVEEVLRFCGHFPAMSYADVSQTVIEGVAVYLGFHEDYV